MVRCPHPACELLVRTMLDEETTLGDLLKNRSSCKKKLVYLTFRESQCEGQLLLQDHANINRDPP